MRIFRIGLAVGLWISLPLAAADSLKVVVSIPPQQWLVEQIGGDGLEVEVLVSPGESPTTYQPTDVQVTHLLQARIYFSIGVPFERGSWFEAIGKMGRLERVDLLQGIDLPLIKKISGLNV